MDELTLGGKNYISAKRAAKLAGYAKDYVGQLCREGELEATKVGRNWYVREESLKRHRKHFKGTPVVDWDPTIVHQKSSEPIELKEAVAKRALRETSQEERRRKEELINALFDLRYEKDERPLVPSTSRHAMIEETQYENQSNDMVSHEAVQEGKNEESIPSDENVFSDSQANKRTEENEETTFVAIPATGTEYRARPTLLSRQASSPHPSHRAPLSSYGRYTKKEKISAEGLSYPEGNLLRKAHLFIAGSVLILLGLSLFLIESTGVYERRGQDFTATAAGVALRDFGSFLPNISNK